MQFATSAGSLACRQRRCPAPGRAQPRQAYERDVRKTVESLRSNSGDHVDFVLVGPGLLTPGDAADLAMTIESMMRILTKDCARPALTSFTKIGGEPFRCEY